MVSHPRIVRRRGAEGNSIAKQTAERAPNENVSAERFCTERFDSSLTGSRSATSRKKAALLRDMFNGQVQ